MLTKNSSTKAVKALKTGEITIHEGENAWELFSKEAFVAGWDVLYEACPWATVFQSRAFVTTWYEIYRQQFLPVILTSSDETHLTGLLTLARDNSGRITGAGEDQGEYQVWLTTETNGETFIKNALLAVGTRFPGNSVELKYIPGNAPIKWIEKDTVLRKRCRIVTFNQPLMVIDDTHLTHELKKKNRREKINRLKRLGALTFERITDHRVFASILDELAAQFEFRKVAMYNAPLFLNDPLRKTFLQALFGKNLLHATVLRVNEVIIAANVGTTGKGWVHLQGLNSHAPSYARYSPGILHFLMLGKLLAEEGIEVFDLTPGNDAYKDGLATEQVLAYKLNMGSRSSHWAESLKYAAIRLAKRTVAPLGIDRSRLRRMRWEAIMALKKLIHIWRQGMSFLVKGLIKRIVWGKKTRMYKGPMVESLPPADPIDLNKNNLRDLLLFEHRGSWLSRWEFIEAAMRRLEEGQCSYTFAENGRLLGCVWLADRKPFSATSKDHPTSQGFALLQNFYLHPEGRHRLKDFLTVLVREHNQNCVYAKAPAHDRYLCQALEAIGFKAGNEDFGTGEMS